MNLWVIFLTGLTTGGLSCLAVQGGLLATALTRRRAARAERPHRPARTRRTPGKRAAAAAGVEFAREPWPIAYFLGAKLAAYTLLGALLGALGSAIQLSPPVQAVMQIAAGLFMLATALNMLDIHPIFRYAAIQPPKALARLVRDQSKSASIFAPALLGLMTIFIPCGVTQAMEVLAITSAAPLLGALIMFAFVLGTSPTFFVLGFLATRVRGRFQHAFMVAAAVLVVFLGIVSVDGGLNLLGSPLAPSRILAAVLPPGETAAPAPGSRPQGRMVAGAQEFTIDALDNGYSPRYLEASSGTPLRLRLETSNSYSCTRVFTIPSLGIRRVLPETGEVVIELPAQPSGPLFFTCGMGMYSGIIQIG